MLTKSWTTTSSSRVSLNRGAMTLDVLNTRGLYCLELLLLDWLVLRVCYRVVGFVPRILSNGRLWFFGCVKGLYTFPCIFRQILSLHGALARIDD